MRHLTSTLIVTCCLCSGTAWAEEARTVGNTTYVDRLNEGHRLVLNNQYDAALRAYQGALDVVLNDPLATYLIACVHRAAGNLDQALEAFQHVVSYAGEDHALHARALMNIAFIQEQRREFSAAREAWQAYISFAETHQDIPTYVANARQRLDVITAVEELNQAYEPVRQRIAQRAASSGN